MWSHGFWNGEVKRKLQRLEDDYYQLEACQKLSKRRYNAAAKKLLESCVLNDYSHNDYKRESNALFKEYVKDFEQILKLKYHIVNKAKVIINYEN